MFKTRDIESFLHAAVLNAEGDRRFAKCQFRIQGVEYELAKEISPKIADRLFRLNGKQEWIPVEEMPRCRFSPGSIARQSMEFIQLPNTGTPGRIDDVEVTRLEATIEGGDITLHFTLRFPIADKGIASRLVIDLLQQTVFLSFTPAQRRLNFDARESAGLGTFVNNRSRGRREGFSEMGGGNLR